MRKVDGSSHRGNNDYGDSIGALDVHSGTAPPAGCAQFKGHKGNHD
jgi:hypothetical protein